MMRTMQMNNSLATHGAQVHNIQIKPVSGGKRRSGPGGASNLIQAQFLSSSGQGQSSQGGGANQTNISVSSILNSRASKEKA